MTGSYPDGERCWSGLVATLTLSCLWSGWFFVTYRSVDGETLVYVNSNEIIVSGLGARIPLGVEPGWRGQEALDRSDVPSPLILGHISPASARLSAVKAARERCLLVQRRN